MVSMYGMLLESVQHFIQLHYGEGAWLNVLRHAGMHNAVFTTHEIFDDDTMVKLAHSCAQVLGDRSRDEFMRFFGECFVLYFSHYGYDKMLRVCGRHFRDFLHGIDNLHETMRFSYPKMLSPSFHVSREDAGGCILHYRSKRKGFSGYVMGQLAQYAKKFYDIDLTIYIQEETVSGTGCHVVYRLDFDNSYHNKQQCAHTAKKSTFPCIPGSFFFTVFPFSIVFNQSLMITHAGPSISGLFKSCPLIGANLKSRFHLRRPQMSITWENVSDNMRGCFVVTSTSIRRRFFEV